MDVSQNILLHFETKLTDHDVITLQCVFVFVKLGNETMQSDWRKASR